MNTRLKAFLQAEQLSSARFAELMNIQRSGVTHLLSGRNKPGYDFFEKFLRKFPAVNLDWLISGRGKMYKEQYAGSLFTEQPVSTPQAHDEETFPYGSMYNAASPRETPQSIAPEYSSPVKQGKRIEKVILFYSDGSFEAFN